MEMSSLADPILVILTTLVAAQIFINKALITRSDKAQAQRDANIAKLIDGLMISVDAFRNFEAEEHKTHANIVHTQERILTALERVAAKLER